MKIAEVRAHCLSYGAAIRQARENKEQAVGHARSLSQWILGKDATDLDPQADCTKDQEVRNSCMALAFQCRTGKAFPAHLTEHADLFYVFVNTKKKPAKAAAPKPDKPSGGFMRKTSSKKDDKDKK